MKTLFIFRRDLRTFDNTALNRVVEKYPKTEIIPIFIFNKKQIEETDNKYYSKNAVQFLFESLDEISDFTNFFYTSTNDIPILETLFNKYKFDNLAFNIDYTPYAIKRDKEIKAWANEKKVELITFEDYTLHNIGEIVKDNKEPYQKFTPFYKKKYNKKASFIID